MPQGLPHHREPLIIGLAGGIGSGKSAVAASFARQGCAVIDSDAEAKEALQRPDVRDTMVSWWGPAILTPAGTVDRAAIARVVFADPLQRGRLEGLIHPLIRRTRESAQAEARLAGTPAIVYDAPLLFEVGLDALCDAVVFVECPRDERLRRVSVSRGWTESDLSRREAAQWPLDRKRIASTFTVNNGPITLHADRSGGVAPGRESPAAAAEVAANLDTQTARILAILLANTESGPPGSPGTQANR